MNFQDRVSCEQMLAMMGQVEEILASLLRTLRMAADGDNREHLQHIAVAKATIARCATLEIKAEMFDWTRSFPHETPERF